MKLKLVLGKGSMNKDVKPLGRHQRDIVEPKYSEVMKSGKYDNVMNYFGESVEHYGKKDAPTYFAEECFQTITKI